MSTIRKWLDEAKKYPTRTGVTGWTTYRDDLMALLSECSTGVVCSVTPTHLDGDGEAFHVQLYLSFDGTDGADEEQAR